MDVALHPDYAKNGWIYLSYVRAGDDAGASMTVIVRGRVRDGKWVDQEILYKAPPELYWADNTHFGSRFLFDKEGHLFYSIGDRGHQNDAQDLSLPERQDPPHPRRRAHPRGQPVRGQAGRPGLDLELRQPQRPGNGLAPGDRRPVGDRARPPGRRRAEPHRARPQLRLARHHLRHQLRRHPDLRQDRAGGHGAAGGAVDAVARHLRDRLLHRRQASRAGRTTCS